MTFANGDQPSVQIMHFGVFPTPESIFEAFDFTVCMGAFDLDLGEFEFHPDFMKHCAQRFLSFNPRTRFPYASAWRVKKYTERGFTIGKMEYMKILLACQNKPITSWDELKEQVGGVYGEAFTVPDGEEFSLDAAYKAVATLRWSPAKGGYGSAEEAIAMTSSREIRTLTHDGKTYVMIDDDDSLTEVPSEPKNPKRVTIQDLYPDGKFYKVVDKADGSYRSMYKNSFVYRSDGEQTTATEPFIWLLGKSGIRNKMREYTSSKVVKAIIEMTVKPEDLIWSPREVKAKAVTFVRECELSEFPEKSAEELPFL